MTHSFKALLIGPALVLFLSSCAAAPAASPAPAIAATTTQPPTALPSPSPLPPTPVAPTSTSAAPASPTAAGPELDCRLNSQFPANGTKYEPRTDFSVRWDVTNTGTAAWDPGTVDLIYTGGTQMYYSPVIPLAQSVAPGQSVTLIVDMKALRNTSSYVTTYALRRGDAYFCRLSVKIYVQWYQGLERTQ